jgi:hypothetical protein
MTTPPSSTVERREWSLDGTGVANLKPSPDAGLVERLRQSAGVRSDIDAQTMDMAADALEAKDARICSLLRESEGLVLKVGQDQSTIEAQAREIKQWIELYNVARRTRRNL